MRASDLLGDDVVDHEGHRIGVCFDVRCLITRGSLDHSPSLQIGALLVSPHRRGALLGYERGRTKGPWVLSWAVRLLHRGSQMYLWPDVQSVEPGRIVLKQQAVGHDL